MAIAAASWGEPGEGAFRVEAESPKPTSSSRVEPIEGEPEGLAVTSDRAWEPVLSTDALGDWTGRAEVWVRYQGGPVNLKATSGGQQTDLGWLWDAPESMTWKSFGVFSREELGDRLIVIRGNDLAPRVDGIAFSPVAADALPTAKASATPKLPTSIPQDDLAPRVLSVSVDWGRQVGDLTPAHWAVNDYSVVQPQLSGQPEFNQYLEQVSPSMVRLHWAKLVDSWTDPATRTWNAQEIKARMDEAQGLHGAELMFCINWWPTWLHEGGVLPAEKEDEFIRLCAELPGVMREIGHPVAMIELPNEREETYEKAGELERLWSLYVRCVEAVRKADPTVRVGGPALTWPKPSWLKSFAASGALAYTDFFTWHNYGSGDAADPNDKLFASAPRIGNHARDAMQMLADAGYPDMPGYLTEYNVSWVWTTRDARMGTNVGAAFQALVVKHIAEAGADGAFVWHVQDGIYGLLNVDGTRRAPAELFLWNRHLVGQMSAFTSQDTDLVDGIAVRGEDGHSALLLIVKADRPVLIHPHASLRADRPWVTVESIVPEGFDEPTWTADQSNRLPGYSVLLLSTRE